MLMLDKKNIYKDVRKEFATVLQATWAKLRHTRWYPAPCHLCSQDTRTRFGLCSRCTQQWQRSQAARHFCRGCGVSVEQPGLCAHCYVHGPAFSEVRAAAVWDERSRYFVHQLKYQADFSVTRFMAEQMAARIQSDPGLAVMQMIPMPQHPKRRNTRGFNQAILLADALSKQLNLPVDRDVAARVVDTPSLTGLNRGQRRAALRDAFTIQQPPQPCLAIVDDVLTTGASAGALADKLYAAGAQQVCVWVFARVE